MPKNSRLKQRARAYAAAHGVSYVEALRVLTAQRPDLAVLSGGHPEHASVPWREYGFEELVVGEDLTLLVNADGLCEEWEYTGLTPLLLLGFCDAPLVPAPRIPGTPSVPEGWLGRTQWYAFDADPALVLGKYPVCVPRHWIGAAPSPDAEIAVGTAQGHTMGKVTAMPFELGGTRLLPAPEAVTMQVRIPHPTETGRAGLVLAEVRVGYLLWFLLNQDLPRLQEAGWTASACPSRTGRAKANLGLELLRWASVLGPDQAKARQALRQIQALDHRPRRRTDADWRPDRYEIQIDADAGDAWVGSYQAHDDAGLLI